MNAGGDDGPEMGHRRSVELKQHIDAEEDPQTEANDCGDNHHQPLVFLPPIDFSSEFSALFHNNPSIIGIFNVLTYFFVFDKV